MIEIPYQLVGEEGAWDAFRALTVPILGSQFLRLFCPDGYECEVLNYGQGEGQISINGLEWGLYCNRNRGYSLVCHEGCHIKREAAQAVCAAVCRKLSRFVGRKFTPGNA